MDKSVVSMALINEKFGKKEHSLAEDEKEKLLGETKEERGE